MIVDLDVKCETKFCCNSCTHETLHQWQQICLHKDHVRTDESYQKDAEQLAEKIRESSNVTAEFARSIASASRSNPRVWLTSFHACGGTQALLYRLRALNLSTTRDPDVVAQLVSGIKSLVNTQDGMNDFLRIDKSVETMGTCARGNSRLPSYSGIFFFTGSAEVIFNSSS